jgi:hypothetical protein
MFQKFHGISKVTTRNLEIIPLSFLILTSPAGMSNIDMTIHEGSREIREGVNKERI